LGHTKSDTSTTSLSIQPSFDYFVAKNFSLGGALSFSYSDTADGFTDTAIKSWGVSAHAGGNVPLGTTVSWRPVVSVGFRSATWTITARNPYLNTGVTSVQPQTVALPDRTEEALVAQVFAPFLIHPARHFFVGIGPDFFTDLFDSFDSLKTDDRQIFIGISSIVGGWFGGDQDAGRAR
jgi:hypothetical protein